MYLKLPYVLSVDDPRAKNLLRQIAVQSATVDGALTPFTATKIQGWLFQPAVGAETILVVPPKTNPAKVPTNHPRVIAAGIADAAAALVDVTDGTWLRHHQLGDGQSRNESQEHRKVLDSWKSAFSYRVEDLDARIIGLRPPQIGALHAVHAHWSVAETPATVVMPNVVVSRCLNIVTHSLSKP